MSVATELAPVLEPTAAQPAVLAPSRRPRHLSAVPAVGAPPCRPAGPSVIPARVPARARHAGVSVLHAPSRIAPAAAPLRLTARGVVVLGALVAVLAGVLLWIAAASVPASETAGAAGAGTPSAVTVRAGDTLWSIATRVAPDRDPRAEVDALRTANHLDGVDIVPGQRLRLP